MALTYGPAIQNQVASTLYQTPYTSLTAQQQFRIDGGSGTSPPGPTAGAAYQAWTRIQQWAQWSELLGSDVTGDAATPWLIAEIVYLASMTLRPERTGDFREARNASREAYLDAIATMEIDDGYEAAVFDPTLKSIRFYVLRHCVKLEKPIFISPQTVDAAVHDRLNWLWNKANWTFRRRKLSAIIGSVEVSAGTWTDSTKVLTESGAFTDYPWEGAGTSDHVTGAQFIVTGGTDTVLGTSLVAQKVGNSDIVLSQSISKIAADLSDGDIAGRVVSVRVFGLQGADRLAPIGTRKLYIDGTDHKVIEWATADELSELASRNGDQPGTPMKFRIERQSNTLIWHFWPVPDADYNVHFDGILRTPGTNTAGVPISAIDTVPFAKLPDEFKVLLKDLVLGKVMKDARQGGDILAAAEAEVDRYAPNYDEPAKTQDAAVVRDVYRDASELGDCTMIGGPM